MTLVAGSSSRPIDERRPFYPAEKRTAAGATPVCEADMVTDEAPPNAALQTAKDLFAGAVGGIAQVLIGEFLRNVHELASKRRNHRASGLVSLID